MIVYRQYIIDFEIFPTGNPKTLVFVDSSTYISSPDAPRLSVLFPGYDAFFTANVQPSQVNTFNSNTIGYTSSLNFDTLLDLPDGVYVLKYEICPYTTNYTVKYICRTTLLEQDISRIYEYIEASACTTKHDKEILGEIAEIHMLVEGCHYIVEADQKKATEFYALAERITRQVLQKLEKCCK
jgi:hypothetical protein